MICGAGNLPDINFKKKRFTPVNRFFYYHNLIFILANPKNHRIFVDHIAG